MKTNAGEELLAGVHLRRLLAELSLEAGIALAFSAVATSLEKKILIDHIFQLNPFSTKILLRGFFID